MSTYWHFHCVQCNEDSEARRNHGEVELQAILDNWPTIRIVWDLFYKSGVVNSLGFQSLYRDDPLEFLATHDTHDVTVESEYGQVYNPNPPKEEPFPAKLVAAEPVVADKEIILEIKEADNGEGDYGCQSGFMVKTNKQEILMLIDSYTSCCESWGYFMSEDDLTRFIGAELLEIRLDDTMLKAIDFEINTDYGGDIMFVTLDTNVGTFQFVAYNEHNGYYGHTAVVKSTQLQVETYL